MSVLKVKTHSVIHDTIEGEAVVMNLESGVYYSFNLPATSIWEYVLVDSPYEEDLLKFAGQHNVDFIDFLLEQGLVVREVMNTKHPTQQTNFSSELRTAEWQVFSDMKDLLLLDPVHDIALNEQGWPEYRKDQGA
jgi:hypothetical protein